jgi:glycerol-3-phosphate responsive antiterminator
MNRLMNMKHSMHMMHLKHMIQKENKKRLMHMNLIQNMSQKENTKRFQHMIQIMSMNQNMNKKMKRRSMTNLLYLVRLLHKKQIQHNQHMMLCWHAMRLEPNLMYQVVQEHMTQ